MMSDAPFSFAPRRAQANRALRKHRDAVADPDVAAFGPGQSGRENVRAQQDVLVREPVRNGRQVRARVGHQQVLRPGAVDRVAESPAAQRAAALRVGAVQTVEALAAWRDRPDDDALPDVILVVEPVAELLDDANRLVSEDQPG